MQCYAASDLVLHCLPISHKKDARLKWVNFWDAGQVAMLRYFKALENNMGQYTRL